MNFVPVISLVMHSSSEAPFNFLELGTMSIYVKRKKERNTNK